LEGVSVQLILNKVTAHRGSFKLFADNTFSRGLHLVCGAVGSGKSTLALIMAGLLAPDTGVVSCPSVSTSMLSLQFPEYHITGLTLADECRSWGVDTGKILAEEGFVARTTASPLRLSRGELKRLHLACLLANEYDMLLLDEPFSALDCQQKEILCNRIAARNHGITVIFTHEREILPRFERYWEIRNGRLGYLGADPDVLCSTITGGWTTGNRCACHE
jgi:energy-coupling factor transport system ATP-binding protein